MLTFGATVSESHHIVALVNTRLMIRRLVSAFLLSAACNSLPQSVAGNFQADAENALLCKYM